jgi:hypothetical protein
MVGHQLVPHEQMACYGYCYSRTPSLAALGSLYQLVLVLELCSTGQHLNICFLTYVSKKPQFSSYLFHTSF